MYIFIIFEASTGHEWPWTTRGSDDRSRTVTQDLKHRPHKSRAARDSWTGTHNVKGGRGQHWSHWDTSWRFAKTSFPKYDYIEPLFTHHTYR